MSPCHSKQETVRRQVKIIVWSLLVLVTNLHGWEFRLTEDEQAVLSRVRGIDTCQ